MKERPFLKIAFFLIALLGGLNFLAIELSLYWTLWWFDILMHFLGGFSVSFLFLYIYAECLVEKINLSLYETIWLAFLSAMLVGGLWEVFEYVNDLTQSTEAYHLDVVHDLLADSAGAMLASLLAVRVGQRP